MTNSSFDVIIAGAGFGGVKVALDIAKKIPQLNVLLINDTPYHCFHSDLYEIATAFLKKESKLDFQNLSGTANIPLKKIFKNTKVEIMIDKVLEVDLPSQKIKLKNGSLNSQHLVLSFGSLTNYYGISGAREYSHSLKTTEDALNIRNDLDELISNCSHTMNVVIAGGGFTGVELAGRLPQYIKKLSTKKKKILGKVIIVEGSKQILSGMPVWVQKKALQRLSKFGVEVLNEKLINKVEQNKISFKNGEELIFDYLIWTTGIQGENLEGKIYGVQLNTKGQIATKQDLSLEKYPNVYVLGDLAECMDPIKGCPVAQTAWAAIGQGEIIAENIKRKRKNQVTLNYSPKTSFMVVPIGERYALSNLRGFKISGYWGWLLKKLISLRYFILILPFFEALILWFRGVKIYED